MQELEDDDIKRKPAIIIPECFEMLKEAMDTIKKDSPMQAEAQNLKICLLKKLVMREI